MVSALGSGHRRLSGWVLLGLLALIAALFLFNTPQHAAEPMDGHGFGVVIEHPHDSGCGPGTGSGEHPECAQSGHGGAPMVVPAASCPLVRAPSTTVRAADAGLGSGRLLAPITRPPIPLSDA